MHRHLISPEIFLELRFRYFWRAKKQKTHLPVHLAVGLEGPYIRILVYTFNLPAPEHTCEHIAGQGQHCVAAWRFSFITNDPT